jgi:hypothetical protein
MSNYWWHGYGAPAVIFKPPKRFVSSAGGATQTGSSADPIAIANLQSAINSSQAGTTFVLSGSTLELPSGLSIATPGIRLIGSGTSDQDFPATILIRALSAYEWSVVSGSVYSSPVSGTVRAVHLADATAKALDALFVPTMLTRNTSTPTAPGINEWGQSGGTLYVNIGADPASRTIWAVNSQGAVISLDSGADDIVLRGFQVGPCAPNGGAVVVAGSSSQPDAVQRSVQAMLFDNVFVYGAWDQTATGAGNGFQVGIPSEVEMRNCRAILCDNDGLNVKQAASVDVDGWLSDRTGDEGASPHYGGAIKMKNGLIANSGYLNVGDGHGTAVWQGGQFYGENVRIFNPRGDGIFVGGGTEYPVSVAVLVNCDVSTGKQETGASYGANGITAYNRAKVVCRGTRVTGFYSQTSGQGNGFYLNNADADHRTEMLLEGCSAAGCRINVRASLAGTTGGSRLDVFAMTNKTPYHQSFASGSARYHEFVGGGSGGSSLSINWKTGGTSAIVSTSATTLSETTGHTDWSYF